MKSIVKLDTTAFSQTNFKGIFTHFLFDYILKEQPCICNISKSLIFSKSFYKKKTHKLKPIFESNMTDENGINNHIQMTETGADDIGQNGHASRIFSTDCTSRPFNFLRTYIMGDIAILNKHLTGKPWILQLPNWILRAIGAPIFLNNPISGLIILIAMFVNSPWIAINSMLGLLTAILTSFILRQERSSIVNGGCTFHGMLVGTVLSASVDKPDWYPWIIFPVIILAMVRYVNIGVVVV